jgi:CDP-glucose 4,6-dehydratase
MNLNFWKNRKVFLTGHTGFKGGWTALWLSNMGAKVFGYSLKPPTTPSFFSVTKLKEELSKSIIGNILDIKNLTEAMKDAKPSVIIHMAAQSLVRNSYKLPVHTFMTNIMGTINIFEAARKTNTVKAIINVTSDKCYKNQELARPYEENDKLEGHDPYSSSKACSELVTTAYRKSIFLDSGISVASARAGNVIGGGDWAKDRLIPDLFRALDKGDVLSIRLPNATRPWQHVLEPISGYLILAERLVSEKNKYAEAWNFGPDDNKNIPVSKIVENFSNKFKELKFKYDNSKQPYESELLKIDSTKSKSRLGWKNNWNLKITLNKTIEWYRSWKNNENMKNVSISQINSYEK